MAYPTEGVKSSFVFQTRETRVIGASECTMVAGFPRDPSCTWYDDVGRLTDHPPGHGKSQSSHGVGKKRTPSFVHASWCSGVLIYQGRVNPRAWRVNPRPGRVNPLAGR
eukprot:4062579-Pyramimonas_sp.AAC.1